MPNRFFLSAVPVEERDDGSAIMNEEATLLEHLQTPSALPWQQRKAQTASAAVPFWNIRERDVRCLAACR